MGPNLALPSRGERDHPPGIGKRVRHWGSGRAPPRTIVRAVLAATTRAHHTVNALPKI